MLKVSCLCFHHYHTYEELAASRRHTQKIIIVLELVLELARLLVVLILFFTR